MFASYSGDESPEEREIIKNVLNSNWDVVPSSIVAKIKSTLKNSKEKNLYGEVIKLLMITSSGAEGISLKNVRYVHILEPYWHHVRINQVIGRARRICSHSELPKELQTVDVFLYLMVFGDELLEKLSPETKLYDKSKREKISLGKLGEEIGLLFQLTDDFLDVKGKQNLVGKPIKKDSKKGKSTLISLKGYENAFKYAENLKKKILLNLKKHGKNRHKITEIIEFISKRTF